MAATEADDVKNLLDTEYKYGFSDPEKFEFKTEKGLNEDIIRQISKFKKEPEWMLDLRLKGYRHFLQRPLPRWGADLGKINFDNIYYYGKPEGEQARDWENVPKDIRNTFDRLGIPEAEDDMINNLEKNRVLSRKTMSLLREIKEETGLNVRLGKPFHVDEWRPVKNNEQWHIVATFFECFSDSDNVILSEDHDKYEWIDPKSYKAYNLIQNLFPAFDAYLKK